MISIGDASPIEESCQTIVMQPASPFNHNHPMQACPLNSDEASSIVGHSDLSYFFASLLVPCLQLLTRPWPPYPNQRLVLLQLLRTNLKHIPVDRGYILGLTGSYASVYSWSLREVDCLVFDRFLDGLEKYTSYEASVVAPLPSA